MSEDANATPSPVVGKLQVDIEVSSRYNLVDISSQISKRKYILRR